MRIKVFLCITLFFLSIPFASSQSDLAIGSWKTLLPYNDGQSIAQSEGSIFYATPYALVVMDKETGSFNYFSKVNSLSNTGIRLIRYAPNYNVLLIAYEDSSIDILDANGSVTTLSDIKRKEILGDKSIYDIYFEDDRAYVACGFGLVCYNMDRNEVSFSTIMNVKVNSITSLSDLIYVATEAGIYYANTITTFVDDFAQWEQLGEGQGFPKGYESNAITTLDGILYMDVNDTIYHYNGLVADSLYYQADFGVKEMNTGNNRLVVVFSCQDEGVCGVRANLGLLSPSGYIFRPSLPDCIGSQSEAIEDNDNKIWIADAYKGFTYFDQNDYTCNPISIDGPHTALIREIAIDNNEIWVASGSIDQSWTYRFKREGSYALINNEWQIYNATQYPELNAVFDHVVVAINPDNQYVYMGSYGKGLIEYDRNNIKVYNTGFLQETIGDPGSYRVSGLAFDEENNLWISNYGSSKPLAVLKNDGTWESYTLPTNISSLAQIQVDPYGIKWAQINGGGILAFDERRTDTKYFVVNASNSELPTNAVNTLAVDKEGDVWVGTIEGLVILQCGDIVFDGDCKGSKTIIQQDNINENLLSKANITSIAVDGANRKWIGTTNGLFVISEDGEEEIHFFNEDNSPLLSNQIIDIAINGETGEVVIGTSNGIVVYRNKATEGGKTFDNSVVAYPNPVRPDYQGPIAIKGLVENANVKITDSNGILMHETTALGGQAIWNGMDYNNNKAKAGVYLVFSARPDGQVALVSKILVVR